MEANVIKCPNCGASSSNHTNCEYCGSLLVRFVDKGIDLTMTTYLTNDFVYEGIIVALKQNLERQELNPDKTVTTDICYKSSTTVKLSKKRHCVAVVGRTGSAYWNDGDNIKLGEGETGLVIKFSFDVVAEGEDPGGDRIQNQYEKFQELSSLPLFTYHTGIYMRSGSSNRYRCREYAIDFGQDYEGAARLISEVLDKVYEIPHDGKLTCLAEDDEVKPLEIPEEPKEVNKYARNFTKLESIGLWIAGIWIAFMILMTLVEGLWFALLICIAVLVPMYYLIEDKWDKNFTWPIVIGIVFISLCAVGSQLEESPQTKPETEKKASNKQEISSTEKAQQEKENRKNKLAEEAYSEGSNDAYGAVETVQDLFRSGYTKDNIRGMQAQQGRLNYKEEYGEPKTSEEKELMELYGKKYAEGFMKTMFKD